MLKIDDFWNIFKVVRGENVTNISEIIETLAKSESVNTKNLFEQKLDQNIYATDDYKRIRQFLMDWYTSHKTLTTIQRKYSDPYSLNDDLLDEIFKSFGFDYSSNIVTKGSSINHNKINFLLDLVKLYRIKGTPESILGSLKYYGFNDIDIIEYFLRKNSSGNLVFEAQIILSSGNTGTTLLKKYTPFGDLIKNDPHWLTSEDKVIEMISNNKIALPSKSPYFSLRATYKMEDIIALMSILKKETTLQYNYWIATGNNPEENASVSLTGSIVSLLELYLVTNYVFLSYYSEITGVNPADNYMTYSGDSTSSSDIINEHNYYTNYIIPKDNYITSPPTARNDRKEKIVEYGSFFTKPKDEDFLKVKDDSINILKLINPKLASYIDLILDITPAVDLIGPFLKDLDTWVRKNISDAFPKLAYVSYGSDIIYKDVGSVINFFKPYRSRLRSVEVIALHDNRLTESVVIEDDLITHITDFYNEIITIDDKVITKIKDEFTDKLSCKILTSSESLSTWSIIDGDISNEVGDIVLCNTGGFVNFDEPGAVYDCTYSNIVTVIKVNELGNKLLHDTFGGD